MSDIGSRNKTALFLMEQLIILMVFIVAAILCMKVFIYAYLTSEDSYAQDIAVQYIENAAELYKACVGDHNLVAGIMDAEVDGDSILLYYDSKWERTASDNARYCLELKSVVPVKDNMRQASVQMIKTTEKELIFSIPIAVQEN